MTDIADPPTAPSEASGPATGVLAGHRILVTGVLTPRSIAYGIAEACAAAGAELVLTSFGRAMSLTERSARRLPGGPPVLEMDITKPEQVTTAVGEAHRRMGGLDGAVHAIGFAPEDCLGGRFLETPWESVATAMQVSTYSMKALAAACAPLMPERGGALLTLTFDASLAWPLYDWMGPAKAALESVVRYLARDLGPRGIRVNSLSAGPLDTVAAKSIPGFAGLKRLWTEGAPLGWDTADNGPVADAAVFLLSSMARGISGEVVHVDGGFHSQGAPARPLSAGGE
ncbi:MAG: enoyl-ACP reductase FabI [Candidatus Dormibacteria bacterium]